MCCRYPICNTSATGICNDRHHSISTSYSVSVADGRSFLLLHSLCMIRSFPISSDWQSQKEKLRIVGNDLATNTLCAYFCIGNMLYIWGVNNHPKDFWYYWTLFSRVAHNGVFILLSAAIAFICTCFKKEGTSAKTRYTCYAFTLFWVCFWFFIF